jgi:hypothetical protein
VTLRHQLADYIGRRLVVVAVGAAALLVLSAALRRALAVWQAPAQ